MMETLMILHYVLGPGGYVACCGCVALAMWKLLDLLLPMFLKKK